MDKYAHRFQDLISNKDHINSFVVPITTTSKIPDKWEKPDPRLAITININAEGIDSNYIEGITSSNSFSQNPLINYESNKCSRIIRNFEEETAFKVARTH